MAAFTWGTPTQIKNMLDPTSSTDAATKNYVDIKSIAGSNTQVLFNKAGNIGASANLIFNSALNSFQVLNGSIVSMNIHSSGVITSPIFDGGGNNLSNIQGANVSGAVAFATTANAVAGANVSGQVANALVASTVYTNAQPNITSVGTLTSLSVSGNLVSNNIVSNGNLTANTLTVQNTVINGNLTVNGNTVYADVTTLNVKDPVIEQGGNPNGNPLASNDGKDRGQLLHYYTTQPVDAFMGWKNSNSEFTFASEASLISNDVTITQLGNVRAGNAVFSNSITANYFSGTLTTASQPNITSVGTLSSLDISGNLIANNITINNSLSINSLSIPNNLTVNNNVTFGDSSSDSMNVNARANFFNGMNVTAGVSTFHVNLIGAGSGINAGTSNVIAGNVYANSGTIGATNLIGSLVTSSQPNITSVGTLSSITVSSNIAGGNLNVSGVIIASGNITGSNLITSGRLTATGTVTGGNMSTGGTLSVVGSATAGNLNTSGDLVVLGNSNLSNVSVSGPLIITGTITGGNLSTGGNLTASGTLSVTGNANVGNIGARAGVFTGAITGATTLSVTGNANVGNLGVTGVIATTGNLSASNITATGALSVTGNVTFGPTTVLGTTNSKLNINASLVPTSNLVYDLGSDFNRWNDLYLSNSTIYLANASISAEDTTIVLSNAISANGVTSSGNLNVSGRTNLNNISNITITGGINGAVIGTDGAGNLSWITPTLASGTNTQIQFNDNGSFAGNAGFTFNKVTGNLTATLLSGTITTVTQPNITSVGTLTSLNVTGNINTGNIRSNGQATVVGTTTVGNLSTGGIVIANGNVTGGNILTSGVVTATGNVSGENITTGGIITATGNISGGNITTGGNIVVTGNITANNLTITKLANTGDLTSANITGSGFANITGNIITAGSMFANSGDIQGNNASITRTMAAGNITTTGNITASGNISTVNLSANGNVNLGAVANVHITGGNNGYFLSTNGTGTLSWASPSAAQGSNTEVQFNDAGTLTGSGSFTFNKTTGVVSATQFNGNATGLTNIPGANVTGNVANATYAVSAGTVTSSSQPNITSVGTLVDANVSGNINVTGNITVNRLTNLGNVGNVKITGGVDGYILKTDGAGNLSWIVLPDTRPGGTTTEVQFNDGNIFAGNSAFTFDKVTGKVSATHFSGSGGNLTNLPAANLAGTIPAGVTFSGTVANATQANVANYAGIVTGNTQSNITAVGTLKRLRVSNSGFNEIDSFAITGSTQAGYFSTTDTSFWIISAANAVSATTGSIPPNPGSGFEISQDINQVTIINAGYQTVTINPHGDLKPKTGNVAFADSLTNNLGGKAGGTDYVYDITGTPAANIDYVTGTYWRISQSSTSGTGTGALFEVITVPAIGGIAYSVIVNNPGTGYAQGDTVTILGANLGGSTPANNLTFKVSQTWDAYWRNLYVGDVNMNNGTGNWTLMAGSDGLYLRNNANGNKYKITMTSVPTGGPTPLG